MSETSETRFSDGSRATSETTYRAGKRVHRKTVTRNRKGDEVSTRHEHWHPDGRLKQESVFFTPARKYGTKVVTVDHEYDRKGRLTRTTTTTEFEGKSTPLREQQDYDPETGKKTGRKTLSRPEAEKSGVVIPA